MPDSNERRFALILQAIADEEQEMADYRKDHAARMDTLRRELRILKDQTLSGQLQLVPEAGPPRITEAGD